MLTQAQVEVLRKIFTSNDRNSCDGGIGPNTLAKLDEFINNNTLTETIRLYQDERQDYYESLSTFKTFGKGWTRRVNETTEFALEMAE